MEISMDDESAMLIDDFEVKWHCFRCQPDSSLRPELRSYLKKCPIAHRPTLVQSDFEHTIDFFPTFRTLGKTVLPPCVAQKYVEGGFLAKAYVSALTSDLPGFWDGLGLYRFEYQYHMRRAPRSTLLRYCADAECGDAMQRIDPWPPWQNGPMGATELRDWLGDKLLLDKAAWQDACERAYDGAYPLGMLWTLQTIKAAWIRPPWKTHVTALTSFQIDCLVEHHSPNPLWYDYFLLLSELGHGGMGQVFLARDTNFHSRLVAIKIIRGGWATAELAAQFAIEAQILSDLDHKHIVPVHAFRADTQPMFIAMKFIEGGPTSGFCGSLSTDQAVTWGVQGLQALAAAHRAGVAHGDLKPSNVVVDHEGNVVIVDFSLGLADAPPPATGPAERLAWESLADKDKRAAGLLHFKGTPYPAPPEQWVYPTAVGPPADIYQFGCTLLEWRTGKHLFDESVPPEIADLTIDPPEIADLTIAVPSSEGEAELRRLRRDAVQQVQHIFLTPPVLKAFKQADVSEERLATIIKKMLAKRPEERPSAAACIQQLAPYLCRGWPLLGLLLGLGCMAAVVAGLVSMAWLKAIGTIGAPDEPRGGTAAVWGTVSIGPVIAAAMWAKYRYELLSFRQQFWAGLLLFGATIGGAWLFYNFRWEGLYLRPWFEQKSHLGLIERELWLAVFWASLQSLPGFLVLLCIPRLRGSGDWSLLRWCGCGLPMLAVVVCVVPVVYWFGETPLGVMIRGIVAGGVLRLGVFFGFLLLSRRVPWGSVDRVQPATQSVT